MKLASTQTNTARPAVRVVAVNLNGAGRGDLVLNIEGAFSLNGSANIWGTPPIFK